MSDKTIIGDIVMLVLIKFLYLIMISGKIEIGLPFEILMLYVNRIKSKLQTPISDLADVIPD